jgi:O-antigen/teichoic acid export membrane protein
MIILGTGKLIELGTGMNAQILQLSKHWRVDLFTNMLFVLISIVFNYFLTKQLGIIGTAIGSVLAIILFNLIRFIYIKRLLKLQPFTKQNAFAILIALIWGTVSYFITIGENIIISHLLKTIIFVIGFSITIIKMNISEDITDLFLQLKGKVFNRH